MKKYTVKNNQIYYVELFELSSNINVIKYGVYNENPDGYSYRSKTIKKARYDSKAAPRYFDLWCNHFNCNLSWEEVTKLIG